MKTKIFLFAVFSFFLFAGLGMAMMPMSQVSLYNGGNTYVGNYNAGMPGVTVVSQQATQTVAEQGIVHNGHYYPVAREMNFSWEETATRTGNRHSVANSYVGNGWNSEINLSNYRVRLSGDSYNYGGTQTVHQAAARESGGNNLYIQAPMVNFHLSTDGGSQSVGNAAANHYSSATAVVHIGW